MKKFLFLLVLSTLPFLPARAELKIVAAENFYGSIAQEIAGGDAHVVSILTNPNQDPHEFTTSAETARTVADADIVIYSGIGYDTWIDKLLANGIPAGPIASSSWTTIRTSPALSPSSSGSATKTSKPRSHVTASRRV